MTYDFKKAVKYLKIGGIGVLPTDTIYGLVGSALNPKTVERIYNIRKRQRSKPMIILISSLNDLNKFNIKPSQKTLLKKLWPNPVSIILPCTGRQFFYLHRGTKTLAFRNPSFLPLLKLLKEVGPLVAPSANIAGQPASSTIDQSRKYFGDKVDFYIDGGKIVSTHSTLIKLEGDRIKVLRRGSFKC